MTKRQTKEKTKKKKTERKLPSEQFKGACSVTVEDKETGSKAILPLDVQEGYVLDVIKLDKGVIEGLAEGEKISDVFLSIAPVGEGSRIACLVELKGTDRVDKVEYAVEQLEKTIPHIQNVEKYPFFEPYLKEDFVMAAIVGAPDRTLPKCTDEKYKALCSKLYRLSGQRAHIRQMEGLLFYVILSKNVKSCSISGKAPYTVLCYSSKGTRISVPKVLEEIIEKNWKKF